MCTSAHSHRHPVSPLLQLPRLSPSQGFSDVLCASRVAGDGGGAAGARVLSPFRGRRTVGGVFFDARSGHRLVCTTGHHYAVYGGRDLLVGAIDRASRYVELGQRHQVLRARAVERSRRGGLRPRCVHARGIGRSDRLYPWRPSSTWRNRARQDDRTPLLNRPRAARAADGGLAATTGGGATTSGRPRRAHCGWGQRWRVIVVGGVLRQRATQGLGAAR